jgi:HAUS augmin-like complex subunit 1
MAHLPSSSAIFSPSVARQAASAARDWSYVDGWLHTMFGGRAPPSFERNPETLRALFALASFNEAADDGRDMLAQAEADAIQRLESEPGQTHKTVSPRASDVSVNILEAVERRLSSETTTTIDAIAATAVRLGVAVSADPTLVGSELLRVQAQVLEQEQILSRIHVLQENVEDEATLVARVFETLDSSAYKPSPDLAKQNLDLQRRIKAMTSKLTDTDDRKRPESSSPTLDLRRIISMEEELKRLNAQKVDLDDKLTPFHGLPSNLEEARAELENRRHELQHLVERRDVVFEGLVEAESPVKRRS